MPCPFSISCSLGYKSHSFSQLVEMTGFPCHKRFPKEGISSIVKDCIKSTMGAMPSLHHAPVIFKIGFSKEGQEKIYALSAIEYVPIAASSLE